MLILLLEQLVLFSTPNLNREAKLDSM